MTQTRLQRDAHRRARAIQRSVGSEFRQLREDAGITQRTVSHTAGISASLYSRIESADVAASLEAWIASASALGADVSVRIYPNTGPRIRDRFQAPMVEALLRELHPRWRAVPEVVVRSPARGVIDLVLVDRAAGVLVAVEAHSEIRRLEQQLRWANEKAASLPSSDLWSLPAGDSRPHVSQLLLLRSTNATRSLVASYPETFRAALPAAAPDAIASLTTDAPWPGGALVWVHLSPESTHLMRRSPRGVAA
ncbi:MAG: helix-turn-helix transcriptional regulator [Chloroflexi bacterium]|nr:helix-turn-helix transcriptional regulator [Chloroflexota bacterium]